MDLENIIANINYKFTFGKCKPKSLLEVYVGTNDISPEYISKYIDYLNEGIDSNEYLTNKETIPLAILGYLKYTNGYIEVDDFADNIEKEDVVNLLNIVFNNTESDSVPLYIAGIRNLKWFIRYINKTLSKEEGRPEYIEWCMENLNYFCVEPSVIYELMNIYYYHLDEIKFSHHNNNLYSYQLFFTKKLYQFDKSLIAFNFKKYDKFTEI